MQMITELISPSYFSAQCDQSSDRSMCREGCVQSLTDLQRGLSLHDQREGRKCLARHNATKRRDAPLMSSCRRRAGGGLGRGGSSAGRVDRGVPRAGRGK